MRVRESCSVHRKRIADGSRQFPGPFAAEFALQSDSFSPVSGSVCERLIDTIDSFSTRAESSEKLKIDAIRDLQSLPEIHSMNPKTSSTFYN